MSASKLRLLLILSCVLFGLGLSAPSMTIVPQFGELTRVVKLFKPEFDSPRTISLASGILTLLRKGEIPIGLTVLLFSVIFPLWKLGVLWGSIEELAAGHSPASDLRFLERLGRFSMLDVMVLAIIVMAVKGLPGGSEIHLNWGLLAFTLSLLLTIRLPSLIETSAATLDSPKKSSVESQT